MGKSFIYNGLKITPKRKFTRSESASGIHLPFSSIGVSNYQDVAHLNRKKDIEYNYNEFYKAAKRAGGQEYDVFEYKGMEVVPCANELFQLK